MSNKYYTKTKANVKAKVAGENIMEAAPSAFTVKETHSSVHEFPNGCPSLATLIADTVFCDVDI